ncbi:uncharacterized protein METZ01_LOCUS374250, partial [marine metagenome]
FGVYRQSGNMPFYGIPDAIYFQHPVAVENLIQQQHDNYIYPIHSRISALNVALNGNSGSAGLFDEGTAILVIRNSWEPQSPLAIQGFENSGGFQSFGSESCVVPPVVYSVFYEICHYHTRNYTLSEVESMFLSHQSYLLSEADTASFLSFALTLFDIIDALDIMRLGTSILGAASRYLFQEADIAYLRFLALVVDLQLDNSLNEAFQTLRAIRTIPMTEATAARFKHVPDQATIQLDELLHNLRSQAEADWDSIPANQKSDLDKHDFISQSIESWLHTACIIPLTDGTTPSHCSRGTIVGQ